MLNEQSSLQIPLFSNSMLKTLMKKFTIWKLSSLYYL